MNRFKKAALLGLIGSALAGLPSAAEACASCGCTLTADWLSQGLAAQPGTTFSLRYDYVPQTVLRSGTHKVDRAQGARKMNGGGLRFGIIRLRPEPVAAVHCLGPTIHMGDPHTLGYAWVTVHRCASGTNRGPRCSRLRTDFRSSALGNTLNRSPRTTSVSQFYLI